MAHVSEPDLLVLHDLRLKGFARAEVVAAERGIPVARVASLLEGFEADGLLRYNAGEPGGWTLTAAGRKADERRLSNELDEAGAREVVVQAFGRFSELNGELLGTCTDWQLRHLDDGAVVNDHSDPAYDADVIARLHAIDDRVQPVCSALARALDRFARYGLRLRRARDHVDGGELEWFDRPTVDSYHSVWFELHEDLLSTLGRERGAVPA